MAINIRFMGFSLLGLSDVRVLLVLTSVFEKSLVINLYHNNRCSKSRAVQALLEESGYEFHTIFYLDEPPTVDKLLQLLSKGDFTALDLVRFGEKKTKELGFKKSDEISDKQWCELLVQYPQLIERPIVETDTAASIGRPIENIQRLLATYSC